MRILELGGLTRISGTAKQKAKFDVLRKVQDAGVVRKTPKRVKVDPKEKRPNRTSKEAERRKKG